MAKADKEKHFVGQIAQKAFIINEKGQVLLVQYPNNDLHVGGKWDLPGGRLNEGETPLEGLKREVREEIGQDIEVHGILTTATVVVNPTFQLYFVLYKASLVNLGQPFVAEPDEIANIAWHDKTDVGGLSMLNDNVERALKQFLV